MNETIERKKRPIGTVSVPFERQIWDASQCAAYIGCSYDTFLKSTRQLKGFPKPLPNFTGHEKWSALAVSDWALTTHESRT